LLQLRCVLLLLPLPLLAGAEELCFLILSSTVVPALLVSVLSVDQQESDMIHAAATAAAAAAASIGICRRMALTLRSSMALAACLATCHLTCFLAAAAAAAVSRICYEI
jgi:hypothetical protein